MRTGFASSLRRLGASLLAVILCALLALPAQALTSHTPIQSAVRVTDETACTGDFEVGARPYTGLYAGDNPVNRIDPSGQTSIGDVSIAISSWVSVGAFYAAPVLTAARGIAAGLFLAGVTFNEQFRNDAAAFGPGIFVGAAQEFGGVVYEIRGAFLAQRVIQTATAASGQVATLGETALKDVADEMLVHFTPARNVRSILQRGLQYTEGGAGVHFFKVGEVKTWTPQQVKAAIGDLAGSSLDVSAAVVVDPTKVSALAKFQKAFWTDYVTQQQNVVADFVRSVPGGGGAQ